MTDLTGAMRRVEESRASHVAWADHLAGCEHCQAHPPQHVHGRAEQQRIVTDYDNVLSCLAGLVRVEAVLAEWDQLSKGETPTTARIRAAINGRSTT